MIKTIELRHKPRWDGKTTRLLERYKEHILNNHQVIYICFSENEAKRLQKESELDSSTLYMNPIISYYKLNDILRGRFNIEEPIFMFLDEPFIYDLVVQQDMLELLESLPHNFYIYGEGTLRDNFRKDFTHYLTEYL